MAGKITKPGNEGSALAPGQIENVLEVFVDFTKKNGVTPSVREVQEELGLTTPQIRTRIKALVNKNILKRHDNGRVSMRGGMFLAPEEVHALANYFATNDLQKVVSVLTDG